MKIDFNSRYDKFKENNLPTPFWDEERQTLEYVSIILGIAIGVWLGLWNALFHFKECRYLNKKKKKKYKVK